MTGLICTIVGIVLGFLAFAFGDLAGTRVTQVKVNAVLDEANRQAEVHALKVEGNLKDIARKLVDEKPSAQVAVAQDEDIRKMAQDLLERARSIK